MDAIASASAAAASRALYTSGFNSGFDFARAELKSGWVSPGIGRADSVGDKLLLRARFGEDDRVVTVVVAVGGRSLDAREIAAPDVAGNLPVSSSRCMRDLRSSNSSHTVDAAVVDTVDSVPSTARGSTSGGSCASAVRETRGDELYVRGSVYDRCDCR
jgi:hypothetical protein